MLDPRLLRTFVAVVETASFTGAADRLNSTQSTVSQHLARLEASVGQRLVDRGVRPITATPAGERLVGYARRLLALQAEAQLLLADPSGTATIRIGVPDDIVTTAMSRRFADFAKRHREIRLEVTTGLSGELTRRFRASDLDIVIVKAPRAESDARANFPEPLGWFQAADRRVGWPDPIPLVTFPVGGLYRDMMIEQLERYQRRWYIAFTGNSLGSVLSAVETGLGASILPIKGVNGRAVRQSPDLTPDASLILSIYAWEHEGLAAELVDAMTTALAER